MSYSITLDASLKVKKNGSHAAKLFRHVARDADITSGIQYTHEDNVDPARTHLNETMIFDDDLGGYVPCTGSSQMDDRLAHRLEEVTGRTRSDAVAMRPLILQLDPQFYEQDSPNWREGELSDKARKHQQDMIDWATEWAGSQNVVGYSLHLDEYSPQIHFLWTPVTDDGRLSQKDWFPNSSDLKAQQRDFREHMQSRGYDVDPDHRVTADRAIKRMTTAEFKEYKQFVDDAEQNSQETSQELELARGTRKEAQETQRSVEQVHDKVTHWASTEVQRFQNDVAQANVQNAQRKRELEEREEQLTEREQQLVARERDLNLREVLLGEREKGLSKRDRELDAQSQGIKKAVRMLATIRPDFNKMRAYFIRTGDKNRQEMYERVIDVVDPVLTRLGFTEDQLNGRQSRSQPSAAPKAPVTPQRASRASTGHTGPEL